MADASVDCNPEKKEDAEKNKRNILEEKSREDLIKLVKKYLSLLQKSKNKTDELSEKCLILEQEKNATIERHQLSEKKLLSKIEVLQHTNSELEFEKSSLADKDQEIEELNQKVITLEKVNSPLFRENEEQLSCLNLQLQSLKASCQCIQEENIKLQNFNKEKVEELSSLDNIYQSLSSDFSKKLEEYDLLLNIKEDIETKYETSIEKIHSLQTNGDKLLSENKDLLKDKMELGSRISELERNKMQSEICPLCENKMSDIAPLFIDLQNLKRENEKLKKQIKDLSKNSSQISESLIESETHNCDLNKDSEMGDKILKLQNAIVDLEQEKLSFEKKNSTLQSELDLCHLEIDKLKKGIKTLATSSQLSDYNMGIEHALLHGGTTEILNFPVEQRNTETEIFQAAASDFPESGETLRNENICPHDGSSGFEFALLQGGDISSLGISSSGSSTNLYGMHATHEQFVNSSVPTTNESDVILKYKNALQEKDVKIEKLKKNLKEYSSLCNDTIDDNNSLKEELENLKCKSNKVVVHQETNTDFEPTYTEKSEGHELDKPQADSKMGNLLHEDYEKLRGNYTYICNKINDFYKKINSKGNFDSEHYTTNNDPLVLLTNIESLYNKILSDLEKKKLDLNDFNLQLELLVIAVRQGVRQKTSITSYQAENNFEENMNLLKQILDELTTRNICFESKKNSQSHSENEMQLIKDELLQLKELKQFLEDENRELNNEIKKIKCNLNDAERHNDAEYFREVHPQNTELYSIDESNEFDDGNEANLNLDTETSNTSDVSVQAFPLVQDSVVQSESNFFSEEKKIDDKENASVQTDSVDDRIYETIKQLTDENKSLKSDIIEKSKLVENIHCEMDNLLTKVEELTVELRNKDDDLKYMQCLNADLKKILIEAENIKNQQLNVLKVAHNTVLDFKEKNVDLRNVIKSFSLTYKELLTNVNDDILNNIEQHCKQFDHFKEMCIHKENSLKIVNEWINEFIKEFDDWNNFMNQMSPETLVFDMSKLERTIQDSSETLFLGKEPCNKDNCCYIMENINCLSSYKGKLFSAFYNHLNNYYRSLVNDLQNYKVSIIPDMEKNIVHLEKKIAEYACQDSAKEGKVVTDSMQEKAGEEALKNSLADTEMKMNKFKQIALKWKKELAQAKEQYNGIILEKESLQKHNTKLTEELKMISDDHCKYVQNYQSLQNEFDKLQDDSEMHKLNLKKLEGDLSTKLAELASLKEKILELENELKSSKNLLDCNLSIKKNLDIKCADLESKIIILEVKINEKDQKINSTEVEANKHLKDLNSAQEENKNLKHQLELAQKEGNKKSVLDLEMADYEKSITELNNKIKKKDDDIEDLQNEIQSLKERINCLQDELKSTESLKETEAKRAESLKVILEKTKLELSKLKEQETELLSKTASFEVQFETMTQQEEDFKLRLSETSAQIQHLQDIIKTSSDNHQRIVRSYEQKISNQKQEILLANKEVESVKEEFENYKIRVHSVLKQQKSVSLAITTVDGDLKEKLEALNEKLNLEVKDLSEKMTAMTLEYEALQEEYDGLLHRYNKTIDDREQKDKEWHQRLELINAEKNRLRAAQEELSSQHLLQNEMLVSTYKKQIKIMSEEHKKLVSDLQKQLDAADIEIVRLQRDQQKLQGLPVTPSPQDSSTSFDLLSQERQEGEGSENTDEANTPIRQLSLATIPTSGFLPFEKLLQSPVEPGTPASYVSNYDSEKLTVDINTANKKIDHLSELLNDSESTNLRMSEQVRVLKDEVRRLENNKEREQHAENLEYLKNVFIKFATLQPGSEKVMLIPVLTTMLKLNSREQQDLRSIAGDVHSGENVNAGWGGYLHRWSGLS